MPEQNPLLFGTYKWLGSQVVDVERFLGETACMRNIEREQYAHLEIAKLFFEPGSQYSKLISFIQRIVQLEGMAMWPRTEVTDLSAKASTHPMRRKKDLGDQALISGEGLEGLFYEQQPE